jgi:hypothetical protein
MANPRKATPPGKASSLDPVAKLKRRGIKTTADLDKWIKEHPQTRKTGPYKGDKYLVSRHGALKQIVGEKSADRIMFELMVQSFK